MNKDLLNLNLEKYCSVFHLRILDKPSTAGWNPNHVFIWNFYMDIVYNAFLSGFQN